MQAVRPFGLTPGDYVVPRPSSMAEMKSPAFLREGGEGTEGDHDRVAERADDDDRETWRGGSSICW